MGHQRGQVGFSLLAAEIPFWNSMNHSLSFPLAAILIVICPGCLVGNAIPVSFRIPQVSFRFDREAYDPLPLNLS